MLLAIVLVVVGSCSLGQAPTGHTSATPALIVEVVARQLAFDPGTLRLPAGKPTGITLNNLDPGILHNVAIVAADGTVVFRGEIFAGIEARTYRVAPLPQGEFRFLCDVHPAMTGALIVDGGA